MSSSSTLFDRNGILVKQDASGIYTIVLDRFENRFNPRLTRDLSDALSLVENGVHPKALVITGKGKFFSNGLDIDWMTKYVSETPKMIEDVWGVLARILVLDCRTVAAINGHAFGAGLFLALACDFRIMRTERGFVNFPEVNLGMKLAKGFAELAKAKCSKKTLREGVLTAKRYTSGEAVTAGLIDIECPLDKLEETARSVASAGFPESLKLANFNPKSFSKIKIELYTDAYRALTMGKASSLSHSRL